MKAFIINTLIKIGNKTVLKKNNNLTVYDNSSMKSV